MRSCDLLDAELALDRVEAELARELPPHLRAFAAAHAAGAAEPPAPAILRRASTLETGRRALAHPLLVERGLALLRLAAPVALSLTVAQRHALAGVTHAAIDPTALAVPPPIAGWRDPDGIVLEPLRAWRELAARHGAVARVTVLPSGARPRAFVVAPDEAIVVIAPRIDSPAARFALRHELGHVLAACLSPPGLPRALDEAVAAYAALVPDEPLASAARERRRRLAQHLDAVERGVARPPAELPWSLVHDPGAQAAYVEAERIADVLAAAPELRAAIAAERDRIDRLPIDV